VHLIGDCTWNPTRGDDELQSWLEEARSHELPVIYLQLGRVLHSTKYVQPLIEELGRQPVRVVASLGAASSEIAALPANFFMRDLILQGQVLPYAHAVICSGTSTNVLGAATAGLPILIITANSEEPTDLAVRCAHAGFGLFLEHQKAMPEVVQQHVATLLEQEQLRRAARQIRQAFAAYRGPERAADLLERLGHDRQPLTRASVDQTRLVLAQ
jgi:UDP:flavonoid glycosyltransferase YjiC (YdhE family)